MFSHENYFLEALSVRQEMISDSRKKYAAARLCHLGGGLAVVDVTERDTLLKAGCNGKVFGALKAQPYENLFSALNAVGLRTVGCEFIISKGEVEGLDPPEFRVFCEGRGWPLAEAYFKGRQIASHSAHDNRMDISDAAARLAFELQAVSFRLLALCGTYEKQLMAVVAKEQIKEHRRFIDAHTRVVLHSIHALFYELAVLRDTLAEFMARFVFEIKDSSDNIIRKMSILRKNNSKKIQNDSLFQELLRITDRSDKYAPGWLAQLSSYRNLFAHIAPLGNLTTKYMTVQDMHSVKGLDPIPVLYYPLPEEVITLEKTRSKGFPYKDFEDWAIASMSHKPDRNRQPDALEYLHDAVNRVACLSLNVIDRSPVTPKPVHLTSEDIIGPVTKVDN